ncbi:hypothetical protein ACFYXH_39035 [Streptomyces sp. NPDC002730]|uniref:hypothetical protein n=1 Tax=Streptomyces sp. NPDC002730 TaxID=3364662 RepID=UPI0036B74F5E
MRLPDPGARAPAPRLPTETLCKPDADLEETVLKGNRATGAGSRGGGLFNDSGTVTLTDSKVVKNRAVAGGGGIFEELGSTVILGRTEVANNTPNNCAPPGAVPGCIG